NVFASVFDSDLIPQQSGNQKNVGTNLKQWKNGRFTGNIGVGKDFDGATLFSFEEGINYSDRMVLGPINPLTSSEGGQLKLLGPLAGQYTVIDNSSNTLRIMTTSTGQLSTRLSVTDYGNVLIGTSSTMAPSEKLEVVGNIISKGTEWKASNNIPVRQDWKSVIYGNGIFVAVASANSGTAPCTKAAGTQYCVMTSSDGMNWATSTIPASNLWNTVTYGNGLYVAMAVATSTFGTCKKGVDNRCIMTSPDGKNWTLRAAAAASAWYSVTYGNGLFVAVAGQEASTSCLPSVAQSNCVMTSPDGINWTPITTPTNIWSDIIYGNGRFVAVANGGGFNATKRAMYSMDGAIWNLSNVTPTGEWNGVTFGNGKFVSTAWDCGASPYNCVMTSSNGIDWLPRNTPASTLGPPTYGNGLFVAGMYGYAPCAGGAPKCILTSPDGFNWTLRTTPFSGHWNDVTYGNGLFIAVSYMDVNEKVIVSGKLDYQITPTNNIYQGGMSIMGPSNGILGIGTTTPEGALHIVGGVIIGGTSTVTRTDSQTGSLFLNTNNQPIMGKFIGGGGLGYHRPILNVNSADQIDIGTSTNDSVIKGIRLLAGNGSGATPSSTISFWTNGNVAPRMTIDSSGRVGIGTTSPQSILQIVSSNPRLSFFDSDAPLGDGNPAWVFRASSSGYFYIETTKDYSFYKANLVIDKNGNVGIGTSTPADKLQVFGDVRIGTSAASGCVKNFNYTSWWGACPSDLRIKKNLVPLVGSLDKLVELKPTYFNWRADEFPQLYLSGDITNLGLIAQDVEKVFPELVSTGEDGFKRVNYSSDLLMRVIQSVTELNAENDSIQARIKALESH
ncbi:MAG: tail fiber domain-containing protein, partial [bacterium]|nr:tail fiber domain-containing protein [bacterium]